MQANPATSHGTSSGSQALMAAERDLKEPDMMAQVYGGSAPIQCRVCSEDVRHHSIVTLERPADHGSQHSMCPNELRVGLLLAGEVVPTWQRMIIEHLAAVDGVEICVIGILGSITVRSRARYRVQSGDELWRRYQQLATRRASALAPTDMPEALRAVPRMCVSRASLTTGAGRAPSTFTFGFANLVHTYRTDLLLNLADESLEVPLGPEAQLWSMQHGIRRNGTDTGCIWELVDDVPLTQVVLRGTTLSPNGASEVKPLATATFPTVPHNLRRNIDQSYMGSVELPAQMCRRVLAASEASSEPPTLETCSPGRQRPGRVHFVRFLSRLTRAWIRRQASGLTRADRWHVGLVRRPIESLLHEPSIGDVEWLQRPTGRERYVADPFGCIDGDTTLVLVEDFDHRRRHGRIGAYRFHSDQSSGQPIGIAEFRTHASYPYLVQVDGQWWCVPEMSAAGEVRAFHFDPSTLALNDLGPLLTDVALADPTLFEWKGLWWLFGTDRSRGANTHLRAWWATHPSGPWTNHAIDPLLIDVRFARSAGTPFVCDGALYRPVQDCSKGYGAAVVIRRVTSLDPTSFEEETTVSVEPDPHGRYPDGLHTISRVGEFFLVDGSRKRFSVASFAHELGARVGRLTGR